MIKTVITLRLETTKKNANNLEDYSVWLNTEILRGHHALSTKD